MASNLALMEFLASDDSLFHYTRTSTALEHILPDGKLKLSLLKDTNDPREYKFKLLNLQGWSLSKKVEGFARKAHPIFDRILRGQCRVMCFCTNVLPEIEMESGKVEKDQYASNVGWNKSRMWSQYGENHHGMCLVFSRSSILKHLKALNGAFTWQVSGHVRYMRNDRIPRSAVTLNGNQLAEDGVEKYCAQHIQGHYRDLFLTKHVDYRDEAEYRFIIADPSNNCEFINITTALRVVIAGDRAPKVYFRLIGELSKKYGAECRRAYWDRGKAHLILLAPPKKPQPHGVNTQ